MRNRAVQNKFTIPAMKLKLADEQSVRRDLVRVRAKMRKDLAKKCGGEKTRGYKRSLAHLGDTARKTKRTLQLKYKQKIEHLREKYRQKEENILEEIPEEMEEFSDLSVFSKAKYEELEVQTYDILTIGEVELSEEEKKVLRLHNKFSVLEDIKKGDIDADQEASIAKLRMEKSKDKEYEGYTDEERKEDEHITAQARMIYDPCNKVFDVRRRRVTDLKECSRITLPKPLDAEDESKIEVRKRTQKEIFEKFRVENTNKKGEQKSNLTADEKIGLKSLQKRIKAEEIIIMKTDKSGRFVVTNEQEYVKMGQEHTNKDIEITRREVHEMEKVCNDHTRAWSYIWKSGDDHDHLSRIISSKTSRSGNEADLTLLFKDHKEGNKTRPVATGNTSYTPA